MLHRLAGAALVAALLAAAPAGAAEFEWSLGSSVGPSDPGTEDLQRYADMIAERSGGRLVIEVVPIETLGFKNEDSLRVLQQGVVDSMWIVPYYLSRDEPLLANLMPHGGLIDADENLKIMDVQFEIADEILEGKWGLVVASKAPFAALRDLALVSKEPVQSLADLEGKKVRHFTKIGLEAFRSLGISTQIIPSSELYLALKTGVVDAAAYGPTYVLSQSVDEVTCCLSYIAAFTAANPFVIATTKAKWEALPDDIKSIVREAGEEVHAASVAGWKQGAAEKEAYAKLEAAGYKVLPPFPEADLIRMQEATLAAWKAECEKVGPAAVANYQRVVEALQK